MNRRHTEMTNLPTEFLVPKSGSAPQSLLRSIRQVSNASASFCQSWLAEEIDDAITKSEEAFELLDHIQNELLRHRDVNSKLISWSSSPFKAALSVQIGLLLDPASLAHKELFSNQPTGQGAMPVDATTRPLALVEALNKLKHRSTIDVNFIVSSGDKHTLFIFTHGGMGKLDSISSFDVREFCNACKSAAELIGNSGGCQV